MPFFRSVCERDIDFLFLEEFRCEPDFVRWFASLAAEEPIENIVPLRGPWHSVCDTVLGESDLVLLVSISQTEHAILIENKIDAAAQPDQAMRYFKRGEQGNRYNIPLDTSADRRLFCRQFCWEASLLRIVF